MKTLVMAVPKSQAGDWPLKLLGKLGNPNTSDPKRWSVEVSDDWIAVSISENVRQDYEPGDLNELIEKIGEPAFYLLESHTAEIMAHYIQLLPDKEDFLIDNDHGWIASVGDYKKAIAKGIDWLYTRDLSFLEDQLAVMRE